METERLLLCPWLDSEAETRRNKTECQIDKEVI